MSKITNAALMKELKRIGKIIEGDPENRNDDGVTGDVKQNTQFRKSIQRFAWIIVTAMMMGNIPILWFGSKLIASQLKGQ